MKAIKLFSPIIFLLCLLSITSCSKDEPTGGNASDNEVPVLPINASVIGSVFDIQNQPIEGAQISIGSNVVVTDVNGVFGIRDVNMNGDGTLIEVEANGYFSISKLFTPSSTAISTVNIQLLEKMVVGSFSANDGGTFTTNGNGMVSIPPNSILSSAGTPYNGSVIVSAQWLDPSSEKVGDQMPGDLRGFNIGNEIVQLATFGMMAVELTSPNGEELNLQQGAEATLTMEIPNSLLNNAPSTIPLWSMNEETGYWEEEGMADKVGDMYVGKVGHFSFWNCDAPFDWINWKQQLVSSSGSPVFGLKVRLLVTDFGLGGIDISDSQGFVSTKVPRNSSLTLQVYDSDCDVAIYSNELGPFSNDIISPTIVLNSNVVKTVNLTGTILDCNGFPVSNGLIKIVDSEKTFPIQANGIINCTFLNCNNTVNIIIVDFANAMQSQELSFNTPSLINDIDIGTESACFVLDEFINVVTVDRSIFYEDVGYTSGQVNVISGVDTEYSENTMDIQWSGVGTGTFELYFFLFHCNSDGTDCYGYDCYTFNNCNEGVNITLFEGINGYIEGEFQGNFNVSNSTLTYVTGSFRVKND